MATPSKKAGRVSPFPHPWFYNFSNEGPRAQPTNHWLMHDFSNAIRSKPGWKTKYKESTITRKWREELRSQFPDIRPLDKMFDYVLRELEWVEKTEADYPGLRDAGFSMLCDDKIVGSTTAIDETTRTTLIDQVGILHDSFGADIDYHPGSDKKVIDLVHPSLFPVQYGSTVIRTPSGLQLAEYTEDIRLVKNVSAHSYGLSKKFQWMPSVMSRTPSNGFKFDSYINNLHPIDHAGLYETLYTIFDKCLPGLNFSLARFASPVYDRVSRDVYLKPYATNGKELFEDHMDEIYDLAETDETIDVEAIEMDRINLFAREIFSSYDSDPETVDFDLKDFKKLKVITKIATIELTPDSPAYNGGSWHVEGTINEDIVATVIYYFDSENISTSRLTFRTAFVEPYYEQSDDLGLEYVYGLKDEGELVRVIGDVTSETNKVVIWPNLYQHHVEPFELLDKTKKGHRKILCFFLCDPYNEKVIASDIVPFQRQDWCEDPRLQMDEKELEEVRRVSGGQLPMSMNQAFAVREQLMQERSVPEPEEDDDEAYRVRFSLCEH